MQERSKFFDISCLEKDLWYYCFDLMSYAILRVIKVISE